MATTPNTCHRRCQCQRHRPSHSFFLFKVITTLVSLWFSAVECLNVDACCLLQSKVDCWCLGHVYESRPYRCPRRTRSYTTESVEELSVPRLDSVFFRYQISVPSVCASFRGSTLQHGLSDARSDTMLWHSTHQRLPNRCQTTTEQSTCCVLAFRMLKR